MRSNNSSRDSYTGEPRHVLLDYVVPDICDNWNSLPSGPVEDGTICPATFTLSSGWRCAAYCTLIVVNIGYFHCYFLWVVSFSQKCGRGTGCRLNFIGCCSCYIKVNNWTTIDFFVVEYPLKLFLRSLSYSNNVSSCTWNVLDASSGGKDRKDNYQSRLARLIVENMNDNFFRICLRYPLCRVLSYDRF